LSDARDLLRFRFALEPACVGEAIENATDATLKALDTYRASPAIMKPSSL